LFLPLISALIGGLIAAVPVLVQSRRQERREALRLAADAALKDYESRAQKDVPSSSPIIFVWYYIRLMQLIEKNKFTKEAIKQTLREKDDLNEAFAEIAVERESRREAGRAS
jgi:hypothetical protein